MKKLIIKNVLVVGPSSKHNGQRRDILVEGGKVAGIDKKIDNDDAELITGNNLHLSPGWIDIRANFWDPGHEYREDIDSGTEAALTGGFSGVALLPETDPAINSKAQVEYIKTRSSGKITDVYVWASIRQKSGENLLSEMHDIAAAGAIGFSSGYHPIEDNGFLLRALLYVKPLGLPISLYPESKSIAGKGQVNEGATSVQMGLTGAPVLAEEVQVANTIALCKYTGTPVHLSCITSENSLKQIIEARKEGLPVTADVSVHHLSFNEENVINFNTLFKLRPPLRTKKDMAALRKAVEKHNFLSVVTDHTPQEEDRKKCEFELAAYGATGLQTCFSQMLNIYGIKGIPAIIEALAIRPRQLLKLDIPAIEVGAMANFTIFDPTISWVLDERTNKSKSRNNPLWKQKLTGRAVAVVNKNKLHKII